jgi:small subunit ribosomal protein S16
MAVKIRLTRMGKKRQPSYRVVVMDSRKPRDGEYIEQIGFYDPRQNPSLIEIDNDKALQWLHNGAQPTERAQKLLEISGAWTQFKVAKGQIHTIPDRPAPKVEPELKAVAEAAVDAPAADASPEDQIAAEEPVAAAPDADEAAAAADEEENA